MGCLTRDANPAPRDRMIPDDPDDRRLRQWATDLADAITLVLPRWVERCVEQAVHAAGRSVDARLRSETQIAGERARVEVGGRVRELLAADIDDQRSNPLTLLRSAVSYPTTVLRVAGIEPPAREATDERMFPDDVYGLSPASFADVDPALHDPGMAWGAAKAYVHLQRRRAEGRR